MKKFARKLFCALLVLISVYVSYIGTAARALTEETDDPASFSDLANDFQGEFSAALEQALSEAPAADFSIPANWAINLHILVLPEDESDDDQSAHYQYALYRNSGTPTYTARNAYDKLGRLATKTLSTAAQTSAFHTTQLDYHTGAGGSQTALLQRYQNGSDTAYQYAYDDNGNINKITQGSRSVSYFYDADNQLTRENNQFTTETITYHYDGFGNITRKITYPYTEGAVTQPAPRQKAPQPPEPSGVCVFVLADNPAERTAGQYVVIERDGETDYALLNNGTQRAEAVTLHGTVQMPERVWTSDASLIWVLTEAEAQADGRKLYKNIGLLGDTDGNGVVTGHDAALILRHAVQRITLDANELARGNTTGTGRATAADASVITREAVELDTIPSRLLTGIYVTPKWIPEPIEPDLQLNGSTATALVEYEYPEKGWRDQLASVQEYRLVGGVLSPYGAEKTIVYDGSGNPSSYLGKTLKWEGKRLVEIAGVATYAYDENGIRLSKTVGGVETKYYYNGTLLMSMTDPSNTLLFSYDASGQVVSVNFNGVEYYYLRNGQGDVVKIISGSGVSVVEYEYDTWGKQLACTGTLASSLGTVQPFRYRGYVYDECSGFYYCLSRYYDPSLKRFISSDVLMSTGQGLLGLNMYAYCLNNPVNMHDPDGTCAHTRGAGGTCPSCASKARWKAQGAAAMAYMKANATQISNPKSPIVVSMYSSHIFIDAYIEVFGDIDPALIIAGIEKYWSGSAAGNPNITITTTVTVGESPQGKSLKVYTNSQGDFGYQIWPFGFAWNGRNLGFMLLGGIDTNFGWVAAHEFGHALGLGDAYSSWFWNDDQLSIMNKHGTLLQGIDIRKMLMAQLTGWPQIYW